MSKALLDKLLALDELPEDVQVENLFSLLEQALASPEQYVRSNLALTLADR